LRSGRVSGLIRVHLRGSSYREPRRSAVTQTRAHHLRRNPEDHCRFAPPVAPRGMQPSAYPRQSILDVSPPIGTIVSAFLSLSSFKPRHELSAHSSASDLFNRRYPSSYLREIWHSTLCIARPDGTICHFSTFGVVGPRRAIPGLRQDTRETWER
jgi:hypothetical protein